MRHRFNLIDVNPCHKAIPAPIRILARVLGPALSPLLAASLLAGLAAALPAQTPPPGPPPSGEGFFPLNQVHRGQIATAWTVFAGTKPEPMQVEILGVLRGARGPGKDMILAQLRGAKPEYTGVVAGMSGSPVYIGNKLLGSLSYRIGQFAKDPIAGITPIAQMLEVKDMPVNTQWASTSPASPLAQTDSRPVLRRHDLPGNGNSAGHERIPPRDNSPLAKGNGRHRPRHHCRRWRQRLLKA